MDKKELEKMKKELIDEQVKDLDKNFSIAQSRMRERTIDFKVFDKIAHMMNLYDAKEVVFSEGSTQSILRKARSQTIQRAPDGQVQSSYDDESIEKVELDFLFNNKILDSQYFNQDMHEIVWRLFTTSWIYGFSAVRTGFDRDRIGDMRLTMTELPYTMLFPEPDINDIKKAQWYYVDEMISLEAVKSLVNENGTVKDSTYNQKTIDYIIKAEHTDAEDSDEGYKLSEQSKGITKTHSIKIRTLYKRGDKEFITYCPTLQAKFRTVKNYDPQYDVPISFLILEPDSSFVLGLPSILPTLTHQQFADLFQSSAYQQLLLALKPPLQGWGNLTPSTIRMEPNAWWNMGTNVNNKVEKFAIETTSLTQMKPIQESISANMSKNMNIMDATYASDASVHAWSKTPQGVEQQQADKTITINQYQQRVERWFSDYASYAIRTLVSAFKGKIEMTVDEETRRRIKDIEDAENQTRIENKEPELKSIINGNKVMIDFSKLSGENLSFNIRTGSFIQGKKQEKLQTINDMLISITQSMGNISDKNRPAFEQIIMNLIERQLELADIDFKATASKRIDDNLVNDTLLALIDYVKRNGQATQQLQRLVINGAMSNEQQSFKVPQQARPRQELLNQQVMPEERVRQQQPIQQEEQDGSVEPLPPELMNQLMQASQKKAQQGPQTNQEEIPEEEQQQF